MSRLESSERFIPGTYPTSPNPSGLSGYSEVRTEKNRTYQMPNSLFDETPLPFKPIGPLSKKSQHEGYGWRPSPLIRDRSAFNLSTLIVLTYIPLFILSHFKLGGCFSHRKNTGIFLLVSDRDVKRAGLAGIGLSKPETSQDCS